MEMPRLAVPGVPVLEFVVLCPPRPRGDQKVNNLCISGNASRETKQEGPWLTAGAGQVTLR